MYNIFALFNVIGHESEGFGINTDIFDTNVINIAILWAIILYVGKDFLSSTLSERQEKIVMALQNAQQQLDSSKERLLEAEKKIAQTDALIEQINLDAQEASKAIKDSLLLNGEKDLKLIKSKGESSIGNLERSIKAQIQETISKLAMNRVVSNLQSRLNLDNQTRYIDNVISQLGDSL